MTDRLRIDPDTLGGGQVVGYPDGTEDTEDWPLYTRAAPGGTEMKMHRMRLVRAHNSTEVWAIDPTGEWVSFTDAEAYAAAREKAARRKALVDAETMMRAMNLFSAAALIRDMMEEAR